MKKLSSGSSFHCIFCYKKVNCRVKCEDDRAVDLQGHGDEDENNGVSSGSLELQKFFTFTERHLGKRSEDNIVVEGEGGGGKRLRELVNCCEDCLGSVRIFNECYHEYKCLELKLAWRLECVWNVMRFADKVPSRVKAFRDGVEGDGNLEGHYDALTRFRQKMASCCREHLKDSFPRVQLIRKKTLPPSEAQHLSTHQENINRIQLNPITGRAPNAESSSSLQLSSVILPFLLLPPPTSGDSSAPLEPSIPSSTLSVEDFEITGVDDFHPVATTDTGHIPEFSRDRAECSAETLIVEDMIHEPDGTEQSGGRDQAPVTEIQDYGVSDDDHLDSESSHDDDKDYLTSVEINANDGTITHPSDNFKVEADVPDTKPSAPLPSQEPPSILNNQDIPGSAPENAEVNDGPRRLRTLLECARCSMKFSNASRLELHQQSEHLENEQDDGDFETASSEMSESSFDADRDTAGTDEDGSPLRKKIKLDLKESSGDDVKPEISTSRWRGPDNLPGKRGVKGRCRAYFLEEHQRNLHRDRDGHPCTQNKNASNKRSSTASCSKKGTKRVSPAHVIVTCPKCPRTMASRVLKYHMEMHHQQNPGGKPLKPGDKLITANGVTRRLEDWVTRKGAGHRCTVEDCAQAYFTEFELQIHSKTHGTFSCGICEESCGSATQLASHELEHSGGNGDESGPNFRGNFTCSRCPSRSASHDKYVRHFLKTHLGLEMDCVRCPICMAPLLGYTDRKRVAMLRHFLDQHNLSGDPEEKVEYCEQCPAYFLDKFRLDDHVKLMHTPEGPRYPCRNCGKVFSKKRYLCQHKKSVTCRLVEEQFQFPCTANESCGRRFETELELERHSPICKFLLPQQCPQCGKMFRGEGGLATHMKTHDKSGEKDGILNAHVCEQCGKAFVAPDKLKNHLVYHQDPESWEFECSVCSKKCPHKYKLTDHMRTHTNEKPYECQTCGVKYAHLHNLRIHRRTKHGIYEGRRLADTSNCASRRKGKKLKKRVQPECGSGDHGDGAS